MVSNLIENKMDKGKTNSQELTRFHPENCSSMKRKKGKGGTIK